MEVVIFEQENVKIKRKKAQPSRDYSTVGHTDNTVVLMVENGKVFLKSFNPKTGRIYIHSEIKSYANPGVNLTNAKGVHVLLLNPSLKPDPSPYIFIFPEEGIASLFNVCIFLAAKASKADELMFDADTIGGSSVSSGDSNSHEEFNPTQDFNAGAAARAQELLDGYNEISD